MPTIGSIWSANDSRRLRAVEILNVWPKFDETGTREVFVKVLYPVLPLALRYQFMSLQQFGKGSKRYSRLR